jgi:hypothetical protein
MKNFRWKSGAAVVALAIGMLAGPLRADDAPVPNEPFKLALPTAYGAFTKQQQTSKSPEGDIETTNWIAKAPTGEAVIVTMSKMPGKIMDAQKLTASTRESLLKTLGATIETESEEAMLFRSSAAVFRARFAVVEDRFYQLLYVGRSDEQRGAAEVSQLFDSFAIQQ